MSGLFGTGDGTSKVKTEVSNTGGQIEIGGGEQTINTQSPAAQHLLDIFSDGADDVPANWGAITPQPMVPGGGSASAVAAAAAQSVGQAGRMIVSTGNAILDTAQKGIGTPYLWGGNAFGKGVDCSGFTKLAYAGAGIVIPRTAAQQQKAAAAISAQDARPGDLVFWNIAGSHDRVPGADHVGIYMGNGKVIEASSSNGRVVIRNLWGNYSFGRIQQKAA